MADIALQTANKAEVVESRNQMTLRAAVAVTAGQAVRVGASGTWVLAKATSTANGTGVYIATRTVKAGEGLTAIRSGVMDGWDLSGLAYGAAVYLSDTDGALATAAGTVSIVLGRVIPAAATVRGVNPDKILEVQCPL
jgi:hypothetical protein